MHARLLHIVLISITFLSFPSSAQTPVATDLAVLTPSGESIDYFARDTFRIDTVVCPWRETIEYEPGDIECGLLQVPESRENPNSRWIELHFVKINAREEEDKRDDPIIYLTGGPGAKATYYIKRLKDHGVTEHRDLYILEQRGIGYSGDFCPYYADRKPEAFDVATYAEQQEAQLAAARDCAQNAAALGVDLTAYNTIENARDVRALRRALGFEQWNVWGISYGSILGQALINEDPDGIRAIALDAIVPIDFGADVSHLRVAKWYTRDLEKLAEACAADKSCASAYPDFADRLRAAVESVRQEPIVVDVKNVERYPSGQAYFFQDIVAYLPFVFFYEQDNYPSLPALITHWADAVERRDEHVFKALALGGGGFDGSQGMYNAISCVDDWMNPSTEAAAMDIEEFPVIGSALGGVEYYERAAAVCREVGAWPRGRTEYTPVQTDIPALIIEGDMDPITPPPLAKAILPGFTNATYVEFPYAGHGPSRSVECAGEMLTAFFDAPDEEPDLSCVDTMEAPDFYGRIFETSGLSRLLILAEENKKALAIPAVWGGASTLVLVFALVIMTTASIGRRIDGTEAVPTFGARPLGWMTALLGTAVAAMFGLAIKLTYDASDGVLLLFGLVPWARLAGIGALLVGLLGLAVIWLTLRARRRNPLPIGTQVGLLLTGLAGVSFSAFLIYWDFGPF